MTIDQILAGASDNCEPVRYPSGYYSPDGDCVFIYNEGGEYARQRVDGLLTLFRAPDDGRIIGVQVKGVKKLPEHQALGVEVKPLSVDERGRRVDAIELLLYSFKAEPTTPQHPENESSRMGAYADALRSFGCQNIEVELEKVT